MISNDLQKTSFKNLKKIENARLNFTKKPVKCKQWH